jgi:hypothetical protein
LSWSRRDLISSFSCVSADFQSRAKRKYPQLFVNNLLGVAAFVNLCAFHNGAVMSTERKTLAGPGHNVRQSPPQHRPDSYFQRIATHRIRRSGKMRFTERTQDVVEYKRQTKKYRAKMTTFAAFCRAFPSAFSLFYAIDGLLASLLQHEERSVPNEPISALKPAISISSMVVGISVSAPFCGSATGFLLLT